MAAKVLLAAIYFYYISFYDSRQPLLFFQVPEHPDIGGRERDAELVFVADRAEGEAPVIEADAAAVIAVSEPSGSGSGDSGFRGPLEGRLGADALSEKNLCSVETQMGVYFQGPGGQKTASG